MQAERLPSSTSLIEILDRVLDKGVVIDVWVRVSLVGIEILTVEARVVIASIETFLKYSEAIRQIGPVAKPAIEGKGYEQLVAENGMLRARLEALPARRTAASRGSARHAAA